jgi:predicted MFS family arabinose efflux permease
LSNEVAMSVVTAPFLSDSRHNALESGAVDWATHWSLAVMLLLGVVHVMDATIIGSLLTPLKQEFGLSDEQLARLSSVFTFAGMVGAPVFGWLTARIGRKSALVAGVVVWSVGSMATGLAGGLVGLLLWRALTGFGEAAYTGLAPSWLADLYRPKWRSLVMSTYMVKNKIGVAVALALGGWAAARYGWNGAFVLAGVPGLALVVLLVFAKEPVAGATDGLSATADSRVTFRQALAVVRYPGFLLHTLAVVLFYAGMNGQTWIPAYLHRVYDLPNKEASMIVAQVLLYTMPAGLIGGYLSSRYLRSRAWAFPALLIVATALAAVMLLVAYISRDLLLTELLIGAATATFGLAMGPLSTLSMETVPPQLRPYATFFSVPVLGVSGIAVSQSFGMLSDHYGLQVAIFMSPAGYLASAVAWLAFLIWRGRKASTLNAYY